MWTFRRDRRLSKASTRNICRSRRLRSALATFGPLFDSERAIRDILGENPRPRAVVEITIGLKLGARLAGELPRGEDECEFPDFVPEEWEKPFPAEPAV